MNGITHAQAQDYLQAELDGLLTAAQRLDLETHLRACETCRAESLAFSSLTARLQTEFRAKWDLRQDGPSEHVLKNIHAKSRRIQMSKKVDLAFNLLGGIAAVLVVGFIAISVISQFQERAVTDNGTETNVPASANTRPEDRLIAFTSAVENGNLDIYTMYPDGSGLTNLTNNPAHDTSPAWSPDGKQIAFQSDRDGFMQIFLMNADGSNVTQLTDNQADHALTLNIDSETKPWSPDGSKLTMIERKVNEETWDLYVMDIDTTNKTRIASGKISLNSVAWSPNGNFFGYVLNTATGSSSFTPNVYIVNADGSNPRDLKELVPPDENPDANYFWSRDGYTVAFTTQNNRLRQTLYEYDLQTGILTQNMTFEPGLTIDWQENLYLRFQTDQNGESSFVWQSPDGTSRTFNWDASCWTFDVTRSYQGNFAIGASCPDKQFHLYWANTDGSEVKQILDMPMEAAISGMGDITWSPDDQYVAIHIATASVPNLYILNVPEALANPNMQPVEVLIGGGEQYFHPAWQPVIQENLTQREPTPNAIQSPKPTTQNILTPITLQTPSIPGEEPRLVLFTSEAGHFVVWLPVAGDIAEYALTQTVFGKSVKCSGMGISLNSAGVTIRYCDLETEEIGLHSTNSILDEFRSIAEKEFRLTTDPTQVEFINDTYPTLSFSGNQDMTSAGANDGTFKARIILARNRVYFVHMGVYYIDWCYCRHQMGQVVDTFFVDPDISFPFEPTRMP